MTPKLRRQFRLLFVLLLAALLLFFSHLPHISWLAQEPIDWTDRVEKIRLLQAELRERFPTTGWADDRHVNYRNASHHALDRLAQCMTENTCRPNELRVIQLGSFHFSNSQLGDTSGEDIWAASLIDILQSNNFTLIYSYTALEAATIYRVLGDLVPLVFLESSGTSECLSMGTMTVGEAKVLEHPMEGVENMDDSTMLGCAKRVGFEEGIPMHKVRSYHFWYGQRHPLEGWTVSPENYTGWEEDTGNYYLGYHIPHCLTRKGKKSHKRQAFILGKKPEYFGPKRFAWPSGALERVTKEIGNGFAFVGGAWDDQHLDKKVEFPQAGIKNLGRMNKTTWTNVIAESAVLVGAGTPPLSPSPYDAWCSGVPFINPIKKRDPDYPENTRYWNLQHEAMRPYGPPYVYHVFKDDVDALRDAIQMSIDHPIPPYIPEPMKRENVEKRLMHLIDHNWTAEVETLIREGDADGYLDTVRGLNRKDGLLL